MGTGSGPPVPSDDLVVGAIEQAQARWSAGEVDEFVESCDRLVRHLFDTSLRLQVRHGPEGADHELSGLLDDLDSVITDAGTTMLELIRTAGDRGPGKHGGVRRRRG